MRRGDLVWVDLGDPAGAEAAGHRPAVVVSNDGANRAATTRGRGAITVVPVTRSAHRVYPFQALLPAERCGLPSTSKAQCEQVRSVDVRRIGQTIGHLPPEIVQDVDDALRLQLSL